MSTLKPLLARQPFVILDGGLGTELQARGLDLHDPLWSAKALLESPEIVADVHRDYLDAGADVIITASYQASIPGLVHRGLSPARARDTIAESVHVARRLRDTWWERNASPDRARPLVAASVGPYGAYLHDGSEFHGNYGLSHGALRDFHRERLEVLCEAGPDLLAIETIPCRQEAEVLVELVAELDAVDAWLSFSCRSEERISNGDAIESCAAVAARSRRIAAVGANCTSPAHIAGLVRRLHGATDLPVVVYPNSGEQYTGGVGKWSGAATPVPFESLALEWWREGARLIGGCCRTTPADIRRIRRELTRDGHSPSTASARSATETSR